MFFRTMRLVLGAAALGGIALALRSLARPERESESAIDDGPANAACGKVDEQRASQIVQLSDLDGDDHTSTQFMEKLGIPGPDLARGGT